MKKIIILTFIFCISNFIKSQNWCPPGAEWYFTRYYVAGSAYTKHTFTNTLTINSLACQQINYYTEQYSYLNSAVSSFTNVIYTRLNNNVVYLYNSVSNNFDTLFNYNAIIGSKWGLPNKTTTNCYNSRVLVTDTGHNYIQGVNLKWFKVTVNRFTSNGVPSTFNDTIYERIGCLSNYFYNQNDVCYPISDVEKGGPLRCYSDYQISNYKSYWNSNPCNYYYNPTTLTKENSTITNFNIYPNPANDFLNIEFEKINASENHTLKLQNLIGQTIMDCKLEDRIEIKQLESGIYFLQLYNKEKLIATEKIIKE